jgi:hypothetical protein
MIKVLPENKALFDRLGITKWHEAGYDGSLGLTMTFERPYIYDNIKGQVENLWADEYPVNQSSTHPYWTTVTHLQVAPGRKIVSVVPNYEKTADGAISGFLVDKLLPWMIENKPDTGFRSLDSAMRGMDSIYGQVMPFCTLCNGAGNKDTEDYSDTIEDTAWLGVGAVNFNGYKFSPEHYSSESEYVDFCGIAPFYVPSTKGTAYQFDGTSCATPFLSGMIALINHFFIQNYGRALSAYEMYRFLKAHCQDVGMKGKDNKTGWGIPILPDPETINCTDWVDSMTIKLKEGEKTYTKDGKAYDMDVASVRIKDRIFVPIRFVSEALGADVDWNEDTQTVTITKEKK